MHFTVVQNWAIAHPWHAVGIIAALFALTAGALWYTVRSIRRAAAPVAVAAAGALVCTLYSADTSWRFAGTTLGMTDVAERAVMFGAGELALLACAVMARANKLATATDQDAGTGGTPGVLVWVVTAVQVFACYSTSGFVGGTVRAIIGPVMAALLWHLAMGLEIRVATPGALSSGLAAQIGRDLRERLLSRLGLATRDRSAEQISRDRATARAVRLASRPLRTPWGRHRLAAAVARSGAGTDPAQRTYLMQQLAARRNAAGLSTVAVASPWEADPYVITTVEQIEDNAPAAPELPPVPPAVVPAGARLLPVFCARSLRPAEPAPEPITPTPEPAEPVTLERVTEPVDATPVGLVLGPWTPVGQLLGGTSGTSTGTPADQAFSQHCDDAVAVAEPAQPDPVPEVPADGTGAADIESEDSTNTSFERYVADARNWLAAEPELTGTAIGTRLGKSDAYGRRVRRAALATAAAQ